VCSARLHRRRQCVSNFFVTQKSQNMWPSLSLLINKSQRWVSLSCTQWSVWLVCAIYTSPWRSRIDSIHSLAHKFHQVLGCGNLFRTFPRSRALGAGRLDNLELWKLRSNGGGNHGSVYDRQIRRQDYRKEVYPSMILIYNPIDAEKVHWSVVSVLFIRYLGGLYQN